MPFRPEPVVPLHTPPTYPEHDYEGEGESAEIVVYEGGPIAGLLSITDEALEFKVLSTRAADQVEASLVLDFIRDSRRLGYTPSEAFNVILSSVPHQNRTHGPLREALRNARRALP